MMTVPALSQCYFMQFDIRAAENIVVTRNEGFSIVRKFSLEWRTIRESEAVLATEVKKERGLNFAPASKRWFRGRGLSTDPSRSI